ncbi:hypothetical protein GR215_23190 [Rhizobium leguminosarum]|uniref:hypothetical protein n=1 Tax=Rhizobium leguminosarum TaxID=384 RepID=UPI0013B87827|nr:hypothetical protein [Rhizobium leguminosarum]NEH44755.1 hypothetical protein [Rhizobium leguminosarum]
MSNEAPPDSPSPKSAVITDNEFSFQPGAGILVEGYNQTVTARNKIVGAGGDGFVLKAPADAPPPPDPKLERTPEQIPAPTPSASPPTPPASPPSLSSRLFSVAKWAVGPATTLLLAYLVFLFGWN